MAEYLSSMHEVWDSIFSKTYKRGKREKERERKKKRTRLYPFVHMPMAPFLTQNRAKQLSRRPMVYKT